MKASSIPGKFLPPSRPLGLCLVLATVTLVLYSQAGSFEFTNYDDPDYASANRVVQQGLTWTGLKWAFTNSFAWHPLTWLSHMVDCQLFGVNPGWHHFVNVLFHVANTLLLFLVLQRMTSAPGCSAVVAALFALHPLHVESVAWVAERKDVLSAFFWMLTLWAYVRYTARPGISRYIVVGLFYALGLMAKPMVVTLPFVLLLLDYWPLRRWHPVHRSERNPARGASSASRITLGRLFLEKIPLLLLSAAASAVTLAFLEKWGKLDMPIFPFTARVANALVSYARYLGKMMVPIDLSVIYPHPGRWPGWAVAGALLLLALITALAATLARRRPYLIVGWLWFLGTLFPVIGLVQANPQAMADRYTYLPLIGVFIMLAWGAADATRHLSYRQPLLTAASAVVMALYAVVTWLQLQHWRDSVSLFSHAVAVTRHNAIAHYNLGQALSMQGLLQEPMAHYEEALRVNPNYAEAHNNLGLTLAKLGRWPEATNHYTAALRLHPKDDATHLNYGVALATLGQWDAAVTHYQAALQVDAHNPLAHFWMAKAYEGQGKLDDALLHYNAALRVRPDMAEARFSLGALLLAQGKLDEAIAQLSEAARLRPEAAEIPAKLGVALLARGQTREALFRYREALRLKADYAEVLNNLAWVLATHPRAEFRDGPEAVTRAERACALTQRKQPLLLGTLAAAYAEAGRFTEAVEAAQNARDLARSMGQTEVAEKNDQLLQLYRQSKPYHESE